MRIAAENYLKGELGLSLNSKNDVIETVSSGLHFLGHAVTKEYIVTDRHTSRAALAKVNYRNLASYQALHLAKNVRTQLSWKVIDEIDMTFDR